MRLQPVAILLLLIGCGGSQQWPGDPALYGAYLQVEGGAYVYSGYDNYKPYLRSIIEATAAHFGRRPEEISGVRLLVSGPINVSGLFVSCGGEPAQGCFTSDDNTIHLATGYLANGTCADGHVLPHELLHVFLGGDSGHTSPLWADIHALGVQLEALSVCH